ncbi:MAG: DUF1501 domain-containing protein [Planctomycetota bacterium]
MTPRPDPRADGDLDRRAFLRGALAAPIALPLTTALGGGGLWLPRGERRTLLVLELQGGNDGLNTVIPVDDADYARLRPTLSAVRRGAHALAPGLALHPALQRLAARLGRGDGAVVHGVGPAAPDRSHFRSRDVWYTADPSHDRVRAATTGWLGRAADLLAAAGAGMPAASLGDVEVPLLLRSRSVVVPGLARAEDHTLRAPGGGPAGEALRRLVAGDAAADTGAGRDDPDDGALAFASAMATAALQQAETLQARLQRYRPAADYPDTDLGRALQLAARLAIGGAGTRLLHTAHGGFDTHAQQLPTHDGLLRQLDRALDAFLRDLEGHDRLGDTVVLVHSEFGRRAQENLSLGTDHGAGAPVFVLGGGVRAGAHGQRPDLARLVDGDVPATTDFRAVHADLLRWLGLAPAQVIADAPLPLGLLPA